jgi:hypothetical protein
MEQKRTIELLKLYLDCIEIKNYNISESSDSLGYLIVLKIPKDDPSVGILLGKGGSHLHTLKQVLRVTGFIEKIRPCVILKLE